MTISEIMNMLRRWVLMIASYSSEWDVFLELTQLLDQDQRLSTESALEKAFGTAVYQLHQQVMSSSWSKSTPQYVDNSERSLLVQSFGCGSIHHGSGFHKTPEQSRKPFKRNLLKKHWCNCFFSISYNWTPILMNPSNFVSPSCSQIEKF